MLLTYDVTDERTFQNIEEWMSCIAENTQEFQIIQKVILANKTDLDFNLHRVSVEDGLRLADRHGIDVFQVSAKEGIGIEQAFQHLTKLVLKAQSQRKISTESNESNDTVLVLEDIPVHAKKESKCCSRM